MVSNPLILYGAGGGSRTHTELPPPDFESGASANSTTPAINDFFYYQELSKCHRVSHCVIRCQNCSHYASNLHAASFFNLFIVSASFFLKIHNRKNDIMRAACLNGCREEKKSSYSRNSMQAIVPKSQG